MNEREMPARFPRPDGPELALEGRTVPGAASAHDVPLDFEQIYADHFDSVRRWARALGGRTADLDDLAQDVFMVVRRRLASFDGRSPRAWLYGITRKVVSDYRRRAWIRRMLGGEHRPLDLLPVALHPSGSAAVERSESQRIVQAVLDRMSMVRRSAFVLFEIEGYSGEEIALLEQVPIATVYTRLHHARKDFLRLTAELTGLAPGKAPP